MDIINCMRELGRAELLHKNFMVKLESHPGIQSAKFLADYQDSKSRTYKCYKLPKREALLMVMSESLTIQTRVYDRMAELEHAAIIPTSFAHALRLAADQAEMIERQHALIAAAMPAIKMLERYVEAKSTKCLSDVAKIIGRNPHELFALLAADKVIFKRVGSSVWLPYQNHIDNGNFR